jgi:hypothetical protein
MRRQPTSPPAEPLALTALGIYVVYMALAFGLRSVIQLRRTGSTGFKGVSGSINTDSRSATRRFSRSDGIARARTDCAFV